MHNDATVLDVHTVNLCNLATASQTMSSHCIIIHRIQMVFVHNNSVVHACILGNDCPWFEKLLQDCIKSLCVPVNNSNTIMQYISLTVYIVVLC